MFYSSGKCIVGELVGYVKYEKVSRFAIVVIYTMCYICIRQKERVEMSALIKIFRLFCMITLVFCAIFAATMALDHLFLYNTPQAVAVRSIERTTCGPAHFIINIAKIDICRTDFKISHELFSVVLNDLKKCPLIFPSGIIMFLFFMPFFKNENGRVEYAYAKALFAKGRPLTSANFGAGHVKNMAKYWS